MFALDTQREQKRDKPHEIYLPNANQSHYIPLARVGYYRLALGFHWVGLAYRLALGFGLGPPDTNMLVSVIGSLALGVYTNANAQHKPIRVQVEYRL